MAATDLSSSLASLLQVPGLQELLNTSITNQRQVAPLRTAAAQYAANTLPGSAFSPAGLSGTPVSPFGTGALRPNIGAIAPANYSTPPPSSSGVPSWLLPLGAALAALGAKQGGSGAGGNIGNLLKKLFGGGGPGLTGPNTPATPLTGPDTTNGMNFMNWQPGLTGPDTPATPLTGPDTTVNNAFTGWAPTGQVDVSGSYLTDPSTTFDTGGQ